MSEILITQISDTLRAGFDLALNLISGFVEWSCAVAITTTPRYHMFTSRYLNNALNSIHERALRMIYNGYEHPFDKIFESNKHKSIHQNNIE